MNQRILLRFYLLLLLLRVKRKNDLLERLITYHNCNV